MRNVNPSVRPYVRPSTNSVIFAFKKRLFGLLLTFIDLFRGELSLYLGLFLGSGPGFGSFLGVIGLDLGHFGPISGILSLDLGLFFGFWALILTYFWVLGLDLVHFGPISGVMGLDLGLFLGSGPRFGSF